jgi:predicted dehydrogenase
LLVRNPFPADNPYLNTAWRKEPDWYGGPFIDAFVHASALIRTVLGLDAASVSAYTSSQTNYIPSVDTMTAHIEWRRCSKRAIGEEEEQNDNDAAAATVCNGVMAVTYSCQSLRYELEIVGSDGEATLSRRLDGQHGWKVTVRSKGGTENVTHYGFAGIEEEILAFAAEAGRLQQFAPDNGTTADPHRNTPEEAIADLRFVEACLESGKKGGELVYI